MNHQPSSAVPLGSPFTNRSRRRCWVLAHGEWKQGEAIPPEKSAGRSASASPSGTLRKAVDELAAENILVRHQGRGTYVAVHTRNLAFLQVLPHRGRTVKNPIRRPS